ncbi:MAG: patatin-like phospholipase family protein [Proteobacteria bacterium]|uniref:patatin-like phospholipase family protein n=1 Tax=Rudaea sp. TaxID=2136325 RepID=UPI00378470FE|nr:patatin-like phospholipase family protein [Pseudomonadota bacterium]
MSNSRAAPTVSLVLGSGGARGYAHIGVIEELRAQGFDIRSIAGCSMGALVGGIYAAGKLDDYRDWSRTLQRLDVLRLLDWTLSGGGFIKGDRVLGQIKNLIGEVRIEELPVNFTAVATDLYAQREVWFSRGPLFDAIRASISIPTVFRPHHYEGRTLVDGGLLNPVPVTPTLRDLTDCTIAVDVNGPDEDPAGQPGTTTGDATFGDMDEALAANEHVEALPAPANEAGGALTTSRRKIASFIDGLLEKREKRHAERAADPGALELFARTLDVVQQTVTRYKLAAQPPDLIVRVPRNACAFYEFHRADELIELGRKCTREAMQHWQVPVRRRS